MSDAQLTPPSEHKEAQIQDQKVSGERRSGYERFFSDAFLLSRGKVTFEQLVSAIESYNASFAAEYELAGASA